MNQPTTYEQLIAAKLQELSAPAKIDAIWASIEHQLDVEMPIDESGPTDTGTSSNPGFYFPGSKFLYVFLAAVAGLYFLTRPFAIQNESSETEVQPSYQTMDSLNTAKEPNKVSDSEAIFSDKAYMPVSEKIITEDSMPVTSEQVPMQVPTKEPEPIHQLSAPIVNSEIKKPLVTMPTTDSTPRKRRGVKGINISDYKIAPVKKDN